MADANNGLAALVANSGNGGAMQNMGAGTVATSQVGGGASSAVLMETGFMQTAVNPVVQFSFNNTGAGNTNQIVRFGSVVCETDTFAYWNLPPSAADDAVITDQYGAGVQYTQGFGKLVSSKAVIINEIKVIMAAADPQLQNNFLYKQLQYDGTIKNTMANIAFTPQMTDQRTNMVDMKTFFLLDSQYLLEYQVLAGKIVSVFFKIEAANMVETFAQLPTFS